MEWLYEEAVFRAQRKPLFNERHEVWYYKSIKAQLLNRAVVRNRADDWRLVREYAEKPAFRWHTIFLHDCVCDRRFSLICAGDCTVGGIPNRIVGCTDSFGWGVMRPWFHTMLGGRFFFCGLRFKRDNPLHQLLWARLTPILRSVIANECSDDGATCSNWAMDVCAVNGVPPQVFLIFFRIFKQIYDDDIPRREKQLVTCVLILIVAKLCYDDNTMTHRSIARLTAGACGATQIALLELEFLRTHNFCAMGREALNGDIYSRLQRIYNEINTDE
jgi:hypothetical protein